MDFKLQNPGVAGQGL